ncbi:MAG: biotin--[acetyl-CoA-carboxylase] ligase [Candidatus Omnitrophota bacterium]
MKSAIIKFLKKREEYISGEEISDSLNISRQALWKNIQNLRDLGYDIVAVPHLGYKLVSRPDRMFPWEIQQDLDTKFIGRNIYYYDTVPSTMDVAFEAGVNDLSMPEGSIFLSETQTKGKGRLGRGWSSPKYKGLYLSLVLKPKILPSQASLLTLLTAVGICEAVKEIKGAGAKIKWPNDILINDKKAAGILTEINAETDIIHFVVIGIGINVNNDKKALPAGAVSLKEETAEHIDRVYLLQEVLRCIEKNYLLFKQGQAKEIIDKWRGLNTTLGRRVKVNLQTGHLEGEAVDIDADGALLLRKDSGLTQRITAGDIVHCR